MKDSSVVVFMDLVAPTVYFCISADGVGKASGYNRLYEQFRMDFYFCLFLAGSTSLCVGV